MINRKIRVIVVDDSALVRKILTRGLSRDPEIEVIAQANDPFQARTLIKELNPDIITLDVEMPRMDGVEFLKRMMPVRPMPVIMVSSLTTRGAKITMDALDAGALDFISKPESDISRGLEAMLDDLIRKVKSLARVKIKRKFTKFDPKSKFGQGNVIQQNLSLSNSTDKVIAIGASTGGTEAIKEVITKFPASTPGVVIVQHMPAEFTKMFAQRLDGLCAMDVKEAEDNDRILPGRILIAPGDYQMKVIRAGGIYKVKCVKEALVSGHRPSVDVLFRSIAEYVGRNAVGAILTGMGKDGALGMLEMRNNGARTISQDEESSVVYGMPMEAYKNGGSEKSVPLKNIANEILELIKKL